MAKAQRGAGMCHQIAFQHCEPTIGHRFSALWWFPVCCREGKIIWKSTSSTLNYLPPEFEQRDEVEFIHSFHPARSGSCFSRRLLDIPVTSSRRPRKHSPGTERQLSLLNRTAKEKQISDVAWNKTLIDGGRWNVSQGERFPPSSSKQWNSILRQMFTHVW